MKSARPKRVASKPGAKSVKKPAKKPAQRIASIGIKRVYEAASKGDGVRILVDRLWPRGLSKKSLAYDDWPKNLAPSNELRKWYAHDPKRAVEFRRRYREELSGQGDELAALRAKLKGHTATLLTATHDIELSHAVVLRDLLDRKSR